MPGLLPAAHRGDFSRWIGTTYRDHVAAALVATAERDLLAHRDADRTRRLLTELLTFRYLSADPPSRPAAVYRG